MLGKLLKHEYRATFLPPVIICAVLAVVPLASILFIFLSDIPEIGLFFDFLYLMIILTYQFFAAAGITLILVLAAVRFYTHVYGAQGYLTLMLPITRGKLLLSKFIVSFTWILLCSVIGSVGFAIPLIVADIHSGSEMLQISQELFANFEETHIAAMIVVVIAFLVFLAASIALLYFSISLGQLFRKRRIFASILIYFGVSALQYVISMVVGFIAMVCLTLVTVKAPQVAFTHMIVCFTVIPVLVYAVFLIIEYVITHKILKTKVNLQ